MADKKDKIKLVQQLLASAKSSIHSAEQMLKSISGASTDATSVAKEKAKDLSSSVDGKVIEGVFNGVSMIGPEDKEYKVPENYASKSKLVQGDVLKLTIAEDGGFIFKQIGPVPRKNLVGELVKENGGFKVVVDGKAYKVITASATYHKAEDGDQVTIIVPEAEESEWAALENVVGKTGESSSETIGQPSSTKVTEGKPKNLSTPLETDSNTEESNEEEIKEKVEEIVEKPVEEEKPYKTEEQKNPETRKQEEVKEEKEGPEEPGEGVKELEI